MDTLPPTGEGCTSVLLLLPPGAENRSYATLRGGRAGRGMGEMVWYVAVATCRQHNTISPHTSGCSTDRA